MERIPLFGNFKFISAHSSVFNIFNLLAHNEIAFYFNITLDFRVKCSPEWQRITNWVKYREKHHCNMVFIDIQTGVY